MKLTAPVWNTLSRYPMRMMVAALSLAQFSCAHASRAPMFDGAPTYPETKVVLADQLVLKHTAGAPCHDQSRPEVGSLDTERSFSVYRLLDAQGRSLCEIPSGLSDPKYAGEFERCYRSDDRLQVLASNSGRTILISEDRSPTFPRLALLMVQSDKTGAWRSRELLVAAIPGNRTNIYGSFPKVVRVSDTAVTFATEDREWTTSFSDMRTRDHVSPNN